MTGFKDILILTINMPKGKSVNQKKRFKKTKGKKMVSKKDKVYGNSNVIIAKFPHGNPLPRRYVCKMRYSEIRHFSGGNALRSVDQTYRMNSMHDPDLTGGGHQPRFYDELATLYNFSRVLGCKITVKILPTDATVPNQSIYVAIVPNNNPTSLSGSTYLDIAELPFSKVEMTNIYGQRAIMSQFKNISTVAGVAPSVVRNDDAFRAQLGSNPATQTYYHIVAGTFNETATSIDARALIDIEYTVQFEDPITPAAS